MDDKDIDIFEKLDGYLPHSDIHYINIAMGLLATITDVFAAFQERNTEEDAKRFVVSVVAALSSVLLGLVNAPKEEVADATTAFLLVLQDMEEQSSDGKEE